MAKDDHERPGLAEVVRALGFDSERIEALEDTSGWRALRCPFHEDRTASASVNVAVGAFMCFACDVSGDVWSLIMRFQGISKENFRDAVAWAEANVGYVNKSRSTKKKEPWRSPWSRD
jgi:DNA primase